MSRHTQGSLAIVGMIAGGIFLVAFVALRVMGSYDVSPAAFLAALVAAIALLVRPVASTSSERVTGPRRTASSTTPRLF